MWHSVTIRASLLDTDEQGDFLCLYNRMPPGFSAHEWADRLLELQSRGFIDFRQGAANVAPYDEPPLEVTRSSLLDALQLPHDASPESRATILSYALTPEGGVYWEDATQANWDHYLDSSEAYGFDWTQIHDRYLQEGYRLDWDASEDYLQVDRLHICLTALDRNVLEASYAQDAALQVIVPDSRREFLLGPWHPCYWKTLPFGYRLGYSVYSQTERREMGLACQTNDDRDNARSFSPHWYRSVFPPHNMSS